MATQAPPAPPAALMWSALALSLLGLGVAAYLTAEHYAAEPSLACPETGVINCVKVTTSSYATVAGVPVALAGLVFFAVMVPLQLPVAWRHGGRALRLGRLAAVLVGVLSVLWLVYVELFRLDAICLWCTAVHVVALLLAVLTAFATALSAPLGDG